MKVRMDPAFVDNPARPWRAFYFSLLRVSTLLLFAATLASFFDHVNWIADLISQFKFQWAFGLGLIGLLSIIAKRWWLVVFCLVGFVVNAYPIWPYFVSSNSQTQTTANIPGEGSSLGKTSGEATGKPLRIMTLNVLTSNREWDSVVRFTKSEDPDFVVLMEVDSTWEQIFKEGLDDYPYSKYVSRLDNFGIALLSKHPWVTIDVFDSETLSLPSIDVTFDGVGLAKPLRIIATHPIPPMTERNWNARNEQLFNVASRFDSSTANLMTGDFNLTPWSSNFAKILKLGGLSDPNQEVSFGPQPTWYVFPTWLGGLKLDHTLISSDIRPVELRVGPDVGSDHRGVIFDFR